MRVVITGSTQGIGRGLAAEFLNRGAQVTVSSRDAARVEQTVEALSSGTGEVHGQACDAAKRADVETLWESAAERFGGVDIWINNAGLARTVWPIMEVPQSDLEAMVATNMLGTMNGCRVAVAGMQKQGSGKIFNILGGGSDGEYFPGLGVYGTTKRGLNYFTDALVKETADSGIVIVKVRPGMVITEAVVREAKEDLASFERSRKAMNRLVDRVETVAPYLVEQMLAAQQSGSKIRWLTPGKLMGRMIKGLFVQREDQFEAYGL